MASSSSSQPYSELTWETAFRRGRHLVEAMRGNSSQATTILGYPSQSQFRTRHDLVDCGWVREDESSMLVTIGTEIAYLPQLETYDLDFSRVKAWGWWHRNSGVNRGTQFDATNACFVNLYNGPSCIIYIILARSPKRFQQESSRYLRLPPLQHWSDITYIEWNRRTHYPKSLKFLWFFQVANTATYSIIAEAFRRYGISANSKRFDIPTEAAIAIMGTPVGRAVAHLLIEHKGEHQLGRKEVEYIHAFQPTEERFVSEVAGTERLPDLHLVFSLCNVY